MHMGCLVCSNISLDVINPQFFIMWMFDDEFNDEQVHSISVFDPQEQLQ